MLISVNHAKGIKDRVVTLSETLLPILREYFTLYKPVIWLFEGQDSREHYSSRSAQQIFKEAYRKLGIPSQCSFHSLRHTFATHLLENGTDISFIQKLLGHNDIKTTLRYTQISKKDIGKMTSPNTVLCNWGGRKYNHRQCIYKLYIRRTEFCHAVVLNFNF